MKKLTTLALALIMTLSLVSCGNGTTPSANSEAPSNSEPSTPRVKQQLAMGTGGTGGAKNVYMGAVAKIVSDNCDGIELIAQASGGSSADLALMQQNEIQCSLVEAGPAWEMYTSEGDDAFKELRCVYGGYPSQFVIVTTDTSINDITQLAGKVVSPGPTGGGTDTSARQVLSLLGIEPAEITNIQWNDAWTALAEGRIDAVIGSCGNPTSAILEGQTKGTYHWVRFTEEQKQTIMDAYPYYVEVKIPDGMYDNLNGDYETVGSWLCVYALEEVDEQVIYDVTKAVMENLDTLTLSSGENALNTQLDSVLNQSIPIHKGALKYYQEMGLEIPDELIPEEAR